MAKRPVFLPITPIEAEKPGVKEIEVEFEWHAGMSIQQKQRSVISLHRSFLEKYPSRQILEASRASSNSLGAELSAFNLYGRDKVCVESYYQVGKVFEGDIGPFDYLLQESTSDLRKKVQELGLNKKIKGFMYKGEAWPIQPKRLFYDWLYCKALQSNDRIIKQLQSFNAFTDIAFNPLKSVNCQAYAVALFRSFQEFDLVDEALESRENFKRFHPNDGDMKSKNVGRKRKGGKNVSVEEDFTYMSLFDVFK